MYILTHPKLFPSARQISRSIMEKTGKKLFIRIEPSSAFPTIRWGNSQSIEGKDTELNSSESIRICSNKQLFDATMRDASIPHVEYHRGVPESFPVVVRTVMGGMGGEGIIICFDREDFLAKYSRYAWSYWYNFSFELGVHLLGGKIAKVFKKVRTEGSQEEQYPVRNSHRGYSFSLRDAGKYEKLSGIVDLFYSAMPIQMTRLDIGWDANNKTYRIIEANTAPGLSENENTLDLYTNFIIERL